MKKINGTMLGLVAILFVTTGVVGCANNNVSGKTAATKIPIAKALPAKDQQKVVVVNKPRQTAGTQSRRSKDDHHVTYDRKRMLYNQQWLARQEAETRQRIQRQKYQQQHAQNLKKQAREQQLQQQQSAARQQQVAVQRTHQNKYRLRQAQIEARQQRHNWQRNGTQVNTARHIQRRPVQRHYAKPQPRQNRAAGQNVNLAHHLANAAVARTGFRIRYDGRYIPISYPMGDVPADMGVCTDVVIRSYRRLGIDLQRLVHEDMSRAFHAYPNLSKWRLTAPDPNIDHRRVHNLRAFFTRNGQRLPVTRNPSDYRPGDLVTWSLGGDQGHIGIVVNRRSPADPNRYMIVHNINSGTKMEDVLFNWPITGHFRYFPGRQPYLASAR